ncbi:MAG: hypothetical protein ABW005_08175 [Burkholderiaceae bacterium]
MWGLTQFDALLTRRLPRGASSSSSSSSPPAVASARSGGFSIRPLLLLDPWGEPVAAFARKPSDAELLKAAHRLAAEDWLGVLADDASAPAGRPQWRLALLRADRPGRARGAAAGLGLQWLSAALPAPAGRRPAQLQRELRAAAVQQLWRHGWRLRA